MEGGVDTGFRHVERDQYEPRFFKVKKVDRRTEVKQIPMRLKNFNSGDVFIMDLGLKIYQFNGEHCSKVRWCYWTISSLMAYCKTTMKLCTASLNTKAIMIPGR